MLVLAKNDPLILNGVGDVEGPQRKVRDSYLFKEHWQRAAELDPSDATARLLVGQWCYGVVNISSVSYWMVRAIFGKALESSWEEAYQHFAAAEAIEPGWKKLNLQLLGECARALGRPDEAREHLLKALLVPIKTAEDRKSHADTKALLEKYFGVTDAPECYQ